MYLWLESIEKMTLGNNNEMDYRLLFVPPLFSSDG